MQPLGSAHIKPTLAHKYGCCTPPTKTDRGYEFFFREAHYLRRRKIPILPPKAAGIRHSVSPGHTEYFLLNTVQQKHIFPFVLCYNGSDKSFNMGETS